MKLSFKEWVQSGEILGGVIQFAVIELSGGDEEDCAKVCRLLAQYFAAQTQIPRQPAEEM